MTSRATRDLVLEFILLLLATLLVVFGWLGVRYLPGHDAAKFVGLVGVGLGLGRWVGTTYTHAFDVLWWWKGSVFALFLLVGGVWAAWRRRRG